MAGTSTIQHKSFPFHIKEFDDAQGIVRGYLSTFDNVDDGGDRVRPGAFKRTLTNKYAYKQKHEMAYLFPLLWQHDTGQPIGGYVDAKEDSVGLFVELQLDLDVQRGREAYSGLKKGYIFQQSMGYDALQSEYVKDDGKTVRDLTEVRLWEGSIVTFPMNECAVVTSVKSDPQLDDTELSRPGLAYVGEPGLEPLTLPAGSSIHPKEKPMQKKTLLEHYNEEMAEDMLEDWQDVYLCSLTCAILDALKIGDQVEADISQALDDFKTLVMGKFVTQAQEVGLAEYLQDSAYSYSPADSIMQYGSESGPSYRGLMSSSRAFARKAGRAISGTNADKIQAHADSVHDMANKAMDVMKAHTKALHAAADDIASMAKQPEDETPPPDEKDGQDAKKPQSPEEKPKPKAASLDLARGATPHSEASTVDEQELEAMLRRLRTLREPAQTH